MSKSLLRLMMAVSLCLGLGLTACGPDDENNTSNNGGECTDNTDCAEGEVCDTDTNMCVADQGPECEMNSDCAEGEVCDDNNMCVPDEEPECEMDSDCADGEECNSGMCETVQAECTENTDCGAGEFCTEDGQCNSGQCATATAGESCDPNGDPAGNGTVCVGIAEGSAVCADTCTPPGEGETDPCSSGSECLALDEAGTMGACVVTQCELGAGDCDSGATCQPISQDTNLCATSGDLGEDEACLDAFGSIAESPCGEGLFCDIFYTGECKTGCNDDGQCSGLDSCVGSGSSDILSSPEGFCSEGCEPFGDRGACGDGFGCFPLTGDVGLCQEAGDIDLYESCTSTPCDADSDCPSGVSCNTDAGACDYGAQCAGDARCITLEAGASAGEDGVARCMPACDPTRDSQDESNATCPQADPTSYVRFQHMSPAADAAGITEVDIYVDGNEVTSGNAFPGGAITSLDFLEVAPGEHDIEIYADGADTTADDPVVATTVDLAPNAQMTYMVVDALDPQDPTSVIQTIQAYSTPRGVASASGTAKVRLFHAVAGLPTNVDVYIAPNDNDNDPTTVPDFSADNIDDPIISNLAYGEMSDFDDGSGGTNPFAELPAGSYDAYVVVTGGDDFTPYNPADPPAGGDILSAFTGLAAQGDTIYTLNAIGAAGQVDPTVIGIPYAASDETRVLGGFCLDLAQNPDESSPNTGVCFEACGSADNLGQDLCSESTDNCAPFRASSVCLPSSDNEVGDSCSTDAFNPCEAGSYCRSYGDGSGECAKLCATDGTENSVLGCPSEEACEEIDADYDVGLCGFECSATDFADDTCPENLKNCLSPDNGAFCSASAGDAVGDDCGDINPNSCVGGAICRAAPQANDINSILIDPVQPPEGVSGQCRNVCSIFAESSDCPDGQACTLDATDLSTEWGFCLPTSGDYQRGGSCDAADEGTVCADNSYCVDLGRGLQCETFCDFQNDEGCPGDQECTAPFGQGGGSTLFGLDRVGLCQ